MLAVSWVEETKVVVIAVPLNQTLAPLTKLLPLTVSVKAALPALASVGDIELRPGCGLLTVKLTVLLVPPPAPGLVTTAALVPAEVSEDAGIDAVSWVAEPQ